MEAQTHLYTFRECDDDGAVLYEVDCTLCCIPSHLAGVYSVRVTGVYLLRWKMTAGRYGGDGELSLLDSPVKHLYDLGIRIVSQAEADHEFARRVVEERDDRRAA